MIDEPGWVDFPQSATGAGREQTDIAGDFVQRNGDGRELAVRLDASVLGGLRLEVVLRLAERNPGRFHQPGDGFPSEFGMRVESGADRRAA